MSSIPRNRLVPLIAGGAAALAIIIGAGFWWADKQAYEKTDNAFVQADTVQVSPQVAGYVVEVLVTAFRDLRAGVSCLGMIGEERPPDPADRGSGMDDSDRTAHPGLLLVRALGREVETVQELFRTIWTRWRPLVHEVAARPLRLWAT